MLTIISIDWFWGDIQCQFYYNITKLNFEIGVNRPTEPSDLHQPGKGVDEIFLHIRSK